MVPFASGGVLLERERELETLRDGVDRACVGEGTLLLIEEPAGAGKTVLAREARGAAERARMMPLEARGSELEQPFAFGVVRQLLEPVISKDPGQAGLFAGAAGPAARLFEPGERRPLDADSGFEALHSLYWLVVNMFAVLFGLSMDYEVFLVSQIKEHADAGEDTKSSVVSGLVTSGRVITAAATIMVFVFGSFVLNGDPTVKQFGIGLAAAVILDATVVRCLLVPARMARLGKANWYLPRWLGRILPRISIEGEEYFKARDQLPPETQLQAPETSTARP